MFLAWSSCRGVEEPLLVTVTPVEGEGVEGEGVEAGSGPLVPGEGVVGFDTL